MVDLLLTSPHALGPAVQTVQKKLILLGFSLGQCDFVYGSTTEAAALDDVPESLVGELAYLEAVKHVGIVQQYSGGSRIVKQLQSYLRADVLHRRSSSARRLSARSFQAGTRSY